MGIRRWLGLPERGQAPESAGVASAPRPAPTPVSGKSAADAYNDFSVTAPLPEVIATAPPLTRQTGPSAPPVRPLAPTTPTEPVGGGLVVGSAERRAPEPELPSFYTPARPYSDGALLRKYPDYDRSAVRDAWALVSDQADKLVSTFYAELFVRLREAPTMFPSSMTAQRQEFGKTLVQWVVTDDPEAMSAHLEQLGADHRKFDVEPRHYEVAGAALASAWKTLAGSRWTQRHEAAVLGSYTRLASTMLDGAMRNLSQPASWGAKVIDHQQILSDFAVVRIQPDEPYPYKAGQYLTLEIPSHRRVWRQMSIASAPRADNSFDIHVRAVGGLGVSAALVRNTKVGDRLRLGPPRGNDLVVEPGTVSSGLLCIASGTGAAPISAVVESVLAWREPPAQLDVFVGGRTREDIYPVEVLNRLIMSRGQYGKARAHGVVSDDPTFGGYRGRVESVVPMLRDWASLGVDVLVAGPNPMIEATVTNLTVNRVPQAKIHFDQYEMSAA
jgi:NAD(P)H-flavin reductase/hemoglobin-like flavoprotein